MITTTTTCDRCKRQHRDPHGMPDLEGVELRPFGVMFLGELHLCGRCVHAFKAWLEAGPRDDDPPPPGEPVPVRLDPRSERGRGRRS
jgi:hypothetical protein